MRPSVGRLTAAPSLQLLLTIPIEAIGGPDTNAPRLRADRSLRLGDAKSPRRKDDRIRARPVRRSAGVVMHAFREMLGRHMCIGSAIRQSAVDVTGRIDADPHLGARGLGSRQLLTADLAFVRCR